MAIIPVSEHTILISTIILASRHNETHQSWPASHNLIQPEMDKIKQQKISEIFFTHFGLKNFEICKNELKRNECQLKSVLVLVICCSWC